jgi:hypothetical protein
MTREVSFFLLPDKKPLLCEQILRVMYRKKIIFRIISPPTAQ